MGVMDELCARAVRRYKSEAAELSAINRAIKKADEDVAVSYNEISYMCSESEDSRRVSGKCVVSKMEIADLVNEPGEGVPFLSTRECKHFVKGQHCSVHACPSALTNHKYNDAVARLEFWREQKRKFWKAKFQIIK